MSLSKEAVALLKNNAELITEIKLAYDCEIKTWKQFIESHTSQPVRFKDFHGNEVRDGEKYWCVRQGYTIFRAQCDYTSGLNSIELTYFSTEQAAKDWIELNQPCELSVNEIVEWWFNKSEENNTMRDAQNDLLKLIKAKKQLK